MKTHTHKLQNNKGKFEANKSSRKPTNTIAGYSIVDNRTETVAQQKLKAMADRSPKIKFAAQFKSIVNQDHLQLKSQAPSVIQRVTDLKIQQGPSCWLYVLEAIAKSKGIGTKYLSMAMAAYPNSEKAEKKKKKEAIEGNEMSKRAAALELIVEGCTEMVAKLHNWKVGEGGRRANENIQKKIVERYARQTLHSDASVSHINFDNLTERVNVDFVIEEYLKAKKRARKLADIVKSGDAPELLLNTGAQMIDGNQDENDVHLSLSSQTFPNYVSIKKRFNLTMEDMQNNIVDFTGRNDLEMRNTNHAILLDDYDPSSKLVTYKDPNYGNIEIKITHLQFQKMAGDSNMRMLPFFPDGNKQSRMADVRD